MRVFLFLLPALLVIQSTNTCNHSLHATRNTGINTTKNETVDTGFTAAIQQVLYYTNLERQKAHVTPLVISDRLTKAAVNYAALMAKEEELTHEVNGQTLPMRLTAVNYTWRYIGENIAANSILSGQSTVEDQWMHSSGHKANILNANYTEIGVGIAYSSKLNRYYYCEDFGQPR